MNILSITKLRYIIISYLPNEHTEYYKTENPFITRRNNQGMKGSSFHDTCPLTIQPLLCSEIVLWHSLKM